VTEKWVPINKTVDQFTIFAGLYLYKAGLNEEYEAALYVQIMQIQNWGETPCEDQFRRENQFGSPFLFHLRTCFYPAF